VRVRVSVGFLSVSLALAGSQRPGERLADGNLRRAASAEGEMHAPSSDRGTESDWDQGVGGTSYALPNAAGAVLAGESAGE
jgi:hypothetical protein